MRRRWFGNLVSGDRRAKGKEQRADSRRQRRFRALGASLLALCSLLAVTEGPAVAQPTYKLEVKPNLKPLATLKLAGTAIHRSALMDDPGFRLQYNFKKDGKTLVALEGRSRPSVPIPELSPGVYSVVLELFYPTYKTGNEQKGQFKPVSNEIAYQVRGPSQPGQAVEIVPLVVAPAKPSPPSAGKPALVVHCGKGDGANEKELLEHRYDYKLTKGTRLDGWKAPAHKSHCWHDPSSVDFSLTVPAEVTGTLRLHLIDGDNANRIQTVTVEGRSIGTYAFFAGAGILVEVPISSADSKDGAIHVSIQNFNPLSNAAVSTVEFVLPEKK